MKTLFLLRHAKSGWDDTVARDFDRPLNRKGQRAAALMGRYLKTQGLEFDALCASPATRVMETLKHVSVGYGADLGTNWDQRLYLASVATLMDVLREQPDSAKSALIAGHNPGLEELVLLLARDDQSPTRDAVEAKFPTASLAELRFDIEQWGNVAEGQATLVRFIRPRDLDPQLGPDTD